MKKGGFVFLTLFLLFGGRAEAQHLSHQVLVPAAGTAICSTAHLSQSIGESAITLLSSATNDLTQGFQQPRVRLIPLDQPQGSGVKAYPNPATECLNIELFGESARSYSIVLMDLSGRIVYSTELDFADTYWYVHTIPVRHYVKGFYVVRVRCTKGIIDRTFKISII